MKMRSGEKRMSFVIFFYFLARYFAGRRDQIRRRKRMRPRDPGISRSSHFALLETFITSARATSRHF